MVSLIKIGLKYLSSVMRKTILKGRTKYFSFYLVSLPTYNTNSANDSLIIAIYLGR